MSLLNRVSGTAAGWAVGLVILIAGAVSILWLATTSTDAMEAEWGQPTVCQIPDDGRQQLFGSPPRREVDVICPDTELTAVMYQPDSVRQTVNVWRNGRTGQYFIARDLAIYVNGDEPETASSWPLALIPLAIVAVFGGVYAGFNWGDRQRRIRRRACREPMNV